jgi:hypothetical protein
MHDRAVDHALDARRRRRLRGAVDLKRTQFRVDEFRDPAPELVEIDRAGLHDRLCIAVIDQGEQKVLEGCMFVAALVRKFERTVEGRLESWRK